MCFECKADRMSAEGPPQPVVATTSVLVCSKCLHLNPISLDPDVRWLQIIFKGLGFGHLKKRKPKASALCSLPRDFPRVQ